MAQQVKQLATKSDHMSSVLGALWWEERTGSHNWSSDLHIYAMAHMCVMYIHIKIF